MPVSDGNHVHVLRVRGQSLEIGRVRRDHGSPGFCRCHHERVDSGPATGQPSEEGGATGEGFGDGWRDVAGLEKLVLDGIAPRVTLKTLDKHDGGDKRWPQPRFAQSQDESQSLFRTFCEASHASGVEDQH